VDLGSEFYRFKRKLPERYIGKTFTDVSKELIDKNNKAIWKTWSIFCI